MPKLHYVFDPYCGWCHGAAPLVAAARALPGLEVVPHAGGMLVGTQRRLVTPQWRDYVLPHDRHIAALTGAAFGEGYTEGLLRDEGALLDSAPPSAAILAAQFMARRGLDLLARLQHAHFVLGLRIADPAVLAGEAAQLGLEPAAFERSARACGGAWLEQHLRASRELMARCGGRGFPTFALESEAGPGRIDHAPFLGSPAAFAAALAARVGEAAGAAP